MKKLNFDKWFNAKDEISIFSIVAIIGFLTSCIGFHFLNNYPYNFGKNLAGVFVPPFLSLFYLSYIGFTYKLNNTLLIKFLILYTIQIIPFTPLFFQVFRPTHLDDFERYYLYAKNMFDNNTLWGGDKLFFKDAGYYYVSQPGDRYFIYIELLLFRNLFRVTSFFNIGLYLITIFYFQKAIYKIVGNKKLQLGILLLILLFTPYAIKNLLMELPEWLTAILLMLSVYFYVTEKKIISVFILGFVPFFRQNLLIALLILFLWMFLNNKKRALLLIAFLVPLFLPLYHNLYYAGDWRFFVDIFEYPFLKYTENGNSIEGINYSLIVDNVIHYFGLSLENGKPELSLIAGLFLPFATVLYFIFIKNIISLKERILFIVITMSAIAPIIFLGNAYYPRFEFVNVIIALITFLLLSTNTSINSSYLKENM